MRRRAFLKDVVIGAAALAGTAGIAQASNIKKLPRTHGPRTMEIVSFQSKERAGTIIISNNDLTLHRYLGNGQAERYRIAIGRDGFTWTGVTYVAYSKRWPDWRPPAAMRQRDPSLPDFVPGGPYNPLGARALYLYQNGRDTLYRIHGTNDNATIGSPDTSGCFRLTNRDVIELEPKVNNGTKVIVY